MYGSATLRNLEYEWDRHAARLRVGIATYQSNHEGSLIDAIQGASGRFDGIILKAGAFTHYSYAISDALRAVGLPTVEVHISNIYEREEWRRHSVIADASIATIYGRGTVGYLNAIDLLTAHVTMPHEIRHYGEGVDTLVDVRRAKTDAPAPVAVILHGGFWRDAWKRDTMAPLSAAITQLGWSTVNVEYSRGPGSFPQAIDDVAKALRWVRDNADEYDFDTRRMVIVGHSAGGYLALKIAHTDAALAGVIGLAPVTNLPAISSERPDDDPSSMFIGCEQDADPALWDSAALSGQPLVPVHMIHGTLDETVAPSHTIDYVRDHPETATQNMVEDMDHMGIIDPLRDGLDAIYASLAALS
jgi:3-dehydroquinate dehydratase-2